MDDNNLIIYKNSDGNIIAVGYRVNSKKQLNLEYGQQKY